MDGVIFYIYTLSKRGKIFYIGKTNNLYIRFQNHKLTYGKNINIEILEETQYWREEEVFWIEQFKHWGFKLENKNNGGGGNNFHTEHSKQLISLNQPKTKYRNPKTNIKIGNTHRGMKKQPCSDERKKKISLAKIGVKVNLGKKYKTIKYKKVNQYTLEGVFIREWNSVKDIQKFLNKKNTNTQIYRCLRGEIKKAYKFKWEYKKEK